MIRLHYSNRLEELVEPLAQALAAQQRRDPLTRPAVIVPSQIIAEFLKLRLADLSGVAANLRFPFLRRFLADLIAATGPETALIEADELELVIFECLRAGLNADQPELKAVADYVSAGTRTLADGELRLFELSVRTAHLFREYSISRAPMLARWRAAIAPEVQSMRETERWQRYLFLSIFAPDGRLLPRWIAGERRPCFLLNEALQAIARDRLQAALGGAPLHVFGLAYAGPEFVRIFGLFGALADLHIYALNPCMEFWEDADQSFAGARALIRYGHKIGAALDSAEDPFGLDQADENLALAMWGKPGREYIRLLNELTECDFDAHFKHPLRDGRTPTLLGRIQEDILCRRPQSAVSAGGSVARDDSIRFMACAGVRREVEVAADTIWSLIRQDPGAAPPLRFHQIALLIPDGELAAYLPHIETVFAQRYQIPLNMVDRPAGAEARVVAAVQSLLEFPKGRFNRDALLHLLSDPAVIGASGVDSGQWDRWCRSAGVFFGADDAELAETYIPRHLFHWDQALRRLALGVFMDPAPGAVAQTVALDDGNQYLPCETAQDDLSSVAALVASARRLLAEALDLRERRLPMTAWARLLSELITTWIRPADPDGRAAAAYCAAAVESMGPEELRGDPVGYKVACARALARIQTAQSERGRYAEGGVAAGSFSALRSIPFRVIFALGIGENLFPQRERRDLLDLRSACRRAGDVSQSQRDRYLFLETLLAARERLVLSWVSRDALTSQPLEPSTLVRELQDIIRGYLAQAELDKLTIVHPRNSYDCEYFPQLGAKAATGELVTFDRNAPGAARMAALRQDLEHTCGRAVGREELSLDLLAPPVRTQLAPALRIIEAPTDDPENPRDDREIYLSLGALRRFLECPLQGAAQYALGMIDDEDGGEDDEDEPLSQSVLDTVVLLRDCFWQGRGNFEKSCTYAAEAVRMRQLEGKAPAGPFEQALVRGLSARLLNCIGQAQSLRVADLDQWQRIRIGGAAEEADQVDCVLPAVRLEVPMRRGVRDIMLRLVLRGTVILSPDRGRSINCVARKSPAEPYHFLPGFLSAIALAAIEAVKVPTFKAIVLGVNAEADEAKLTRSLNVWRPDQARRYLTILAEDIFSGRNNYFFPIEAVKSILAAKNKNGKWPGPLEMLDKIESVRESFGHCRSDFGPVRNPRDYPAPPADEIKRIIKRRFEPIITIFGLTG